MKNFLALFLLILPGKFFGQSLISGKILDSFQNPIPYCNILLIDSTTEKNLGGSVSTEDGLFEISTSLSGSFKVKILSIGFEQYVSDIFSINQDGQLIKLDIIILKDEAFALDDISLIGKKSPIEKKIDRTVINLEDDAGNTGSTILDVLERTPGVIVDRQNESLSMLGKGGVNVMINGKLTYMPSSALIQYLNGLNAVNVKSIELITTPPSKFDAEGNAGFINIELKKNLDEGYNGNLTFTSSYADKKPSNNIGSNFNVRNQKHSISFNYSGNIRDIPISGEIIRSIPFEDNIISTKIEAVRDNRRSVHNLRFSYDYTLSEKIELGTSVVGYSNKYTMTEEKKAMHSYDNINNDFYFTREQNLWESAQISAYLKYIIQEETILNFNVDRLKYSNDQPVSYDINLINQDDNLIFTTTKQSPFDITVLTLDFEKKLKNGFKYSAGIKAVDNEFTNQNDLISEQNIFNGFSNRSFLEENVFAAYSQINLDLSKKISLQTGMRYEKTVTDIYDLTINSTIVSRNYGDFFPSLYLGYKINDSNNLNLSVSKRINRPAFTDLAPFTFFVDIDQAFQGNVQLKPSYTTNLETSYRYKDILITAQYSVEKNVIANFQPQIDDTGFITITPQNLDKQKSANLQLSYSMYPFDIWNLRMFSSYTYSNLEHQTEGYLYSNSNSSVRLTLNNNFELGNDFSFQIWGYYNSRSIFGLSETLPRGALNLAVQKKFKSLTLTLNGNNLLDTENWRFETNNPINEFNQSFDLDFKPPQFTFSAVYIFGNQNLSTKESSENEESSRINVGSN